MHKQRAAFALGTLTMAAMVLGALAPTSVGPPEVSAQEHTQQVEPAAPASPVAHGAMANARSASWIEQADAAADPMAPGTDEEPGIMPLTLVLHGPEEWRTDIPVAIVWQLDPIELVPLQSVLHTDAEGRAPARTPRFERRPQWFWADLGFPTLGLAAAPIPDDGGEVVIPMVMPAYVDIEVREADRAPTEALVAELRVPGARTPGDRWHRFPLIEGRGHCMVEAGVDLEVRIRAPSGRTALATVRAPTAPEESTQCRLELAAEGSLAVRLATATGGALAGAMVNIAQRDSGRLIAEGVAADEVGELRFWLPAKMRGEYEQWLSLHATVAGTPLHGELHLDHRQIHDGGDVGMVALTPVPVAVSGFVTDELDRPRTNVPIVLELGREPANAKERARADGDGVAWRAIAETRADAEGRFELRAASPLGARLRLLTPRTPETQPVHVQAGASGVRLVVPPRRSAFGRRSNDG